MPLVTKHSPVSGFHFWPESLGQRVVGLLYSVHHADWIWHGHSNLAIGGEITVLQEDKASLFDMHENIP